MPDKKKNPIKNPGARGGKYYINNKGEVVYGEKPQGRQGKVVDDKGTEHQRLKYDSGKEFKDQFPSFSEFNKRAKEKGIPEIDEATYKKLYQREHKEYMKGVKTDGTKETKGSSLSEAQKTFLSNRIGFDENGFHAKSYDEINRTYKMVFNKDLDKSEYMKFYKKQKYEHSKFQKKQAEKKKLSPEELRKQQTKEIFNDDGTMNLEHINKLPALEDDTDDMGKTARGLLYTTAFQESQQVKDFLSDKEYETYKMAVSQYFQNKDAKFWVKNQKYSEQGMSLPGLVEEGLGKQMLKSEDDQHLEKLYSDFNDIMDGALQPYFEYKDLGVNVEAKKKEAKQKKAERDKQLSTITKKDSERKKTFDQITNDSKTFSVGLAQKLHDSKVPNDISSMTDKDWDVVSKSLGFKVLDAEKESIFNDVINPLMKINKDISEHSPSLWDKDMEESRSDYMKSEMKFETMYDLENTARRFMLRRMDKVGKTFDTPLEKVISDSKKEFDDKLDSVADMSVVADTVKYFDREPDFAYFKDILDKNSSVSETLHSLHARKKEVDSVIDKIRQPEDEEGFIPASIKIDDVDKWNNAVVEKQKIEEFQHNLINNLRDNPAVRQIFGKTSYYYTGGNELDKQVEQMQKISPDAPDTVDKLKTAMTFLETQSNHSSDFYRAMNRMSQVDLRKEELPETEQYRAYAKGTQLFSNHAEVSTSTLIHEMGHIMDYTTPSISSKVSDFFITRTDGTKAYKLSSFTGNKNYESNEVAFVDSFKSPYVGKDYEVISPKLNRVNRPHSYHEVMSMGVQYLYENPIDFMVTDPEHYLLTKSALKM